MILQKVTKVEMLIPEDNMGLVSNMDVFHAGTIQDINVGVNITHPFIGDIMVELVAPNGEVILLHNRLGGTSDNLNMTYSGEMLQSLIGANTAGRWTLVVKDMSPRDRGTLHDWVINMTCAEVTNNGSEIFIPDGEVALRSVQICKAKGKVTNISCLVEIEHPFIGDLHVSLVSPSGKAVVLHNRTEGSRDNINTLYDLSTLAPMLGESIEGLWELLVKDQAKRDSGVLKTWKLNLDYSQPDDLKIVEGIGPKIEQLLNNKGIYTFTKLSSMESSAIKTILEEAGDRFGMHNPSTWPKQAGMAALGNMAGLKAWQDALNGGVDK